MPIEASNHRTIRLLNLNRVIDDCLMFLPDRMRESTRTFSSRMAGRIGDTLALVKNGVQSYGKLNMFQRGTIYDIFHQEYQTDEIGVDLLKGLNKILASHVE